MTEELTVFGEALRVFMERAEISGTAELAEKMREAGNKSISEKQLLRGMHGTHARGLDLEYVHEALGLIDDEAAYLALANFLNYKASDPEAREIRWKLQRAMARRGITPLEELGKDETFSEHKLWWKVHGGISDARFHLERRWIFGEEGEELMHELIALEEKARQLAGRVSERVRLVRKGAA
jgi:hypothetical protein